MRQIDGEAVLNGFLCGILAMTVAFIFLIAVVFIPVTEKASVIRACGTCEVRTKVCGVYTCTAGKEWVE